MLPLMAHAVLLFKLIEEIKQWRIEDLAKEGHNWATPPAANKFLRFSHKNTHFSTLFYRKGHAVSAVTIEYRQCKNILEAYV